MNKLYGDPGVSYEAYEKLRRENERLREENSRLLTNGVDLLRAALAHENSSKHTYAGGDMGEGSAAKPLTPAHPSQNIDNDSVVNNKYTPKEGIAALLDELSKTTGE